MRLLGAGELREVSDSSRIALSRNHKESAGVIAAKHAYVRDKKEVLTPHMERFSLISNL